MEKKRFAVIGAGGWGETHIRTYLDHPQAELVAIADVNEARLKELAAQYGIDKYSTDYEEVLALDEVDAVSIVTPDFAHAGIALAALDADKDILIEKPMANTVEDCVKIREKAEKSGRKFMVDFHNRWNPPFVKAKGSIDEGEVGELQYVYYRLSDTIFVPTEMLSWAGKSSVNWFLASHCLDSLMWLFDDEVESVYSKSRSEVLKARGIDTPDLFVSILQFKNGGLACLENGWILPNSAPNIIDFKVEILGSEGVMYVDGSHHRVLQRYTKDDAAYPDVIVMPTIYGRPMGFAVASIRDFIDCVVYDRPPRCGAKEGEIVTRAILAIEESARSGGEVRVSRGG